MVEHRIGGVDDAVPIRRVLISVSDKSGLEELVPALIENCPGVEILSTGGTYRWIAEIAPSFEGLKQVADYTGQPETDGGLVKTLDYKLYLGLLGERYNEKHIADRSRTGAGLIDMVVVNLYPFEEAVAAAPDDFERARSNIDIGGVTLLRAAAKNFPRVAVLFSPGEYAACISTLRASGGSLGIAHRAELARGAFSVTAAYDSAIAEHFDSMTTKAVTGRYMQNG